MYFVVLLPKEIRIHLGGTNTYTQHFRCRSDRIRNALQQHPLTYSCGLCKISHSCLCIKSRLVNVTIWDKKIQLNVRYETFAPIRTSLPCSTWRPSKLWWSASQRPQWFPSSIPSRCHSTATSVMLRCHSRSSVRVIYCDYLLRSGVYLHTPHHWRLVQSSTTSSPRSIFRNLLRSL